MKMTLVLAASALVAAAPQIVLGPAEAIALAKTSPNGKSGRFEMTVAATGVTPNGTFLNSTGDYTADDNLTFRLSPVVARMLAKRYGARAETWFKGRHVVVDGKVEQKLIVNTVAGRPRGINRFQHEVDVTRVEQLVSAD